VKVVVTGGAGFIGANLCRELLRRYDSEVVVLDDLSTGRPANLAKLDVDLRTGSVLDPRAVAAACEGADTIVHLASAPAVSWSVEHPNRRHDADVVATRTVLAVAREIGAHVVIGTGTPCHPPADLELCVFRLFNVFGPLQRPDHPCAPVIPSFIVNALNGRPVTIYGDGEQSRDFTFVTTAAEVIAEAVGRRLTGPAPVDLTFGVPTTTNEVVAVLSDLLGRRVDVRRKPPRAGQLRHVPVWPGGVTTLFPKIRPVSLPHGLLRTLSWLERQVTSVAGPSGAPA
jgi:UDP-glucose 4-epimerase